MNELNLDSDYIEYLIYSYQLTNEDFEDILYQLKEDMYEGKVNEFTLIKKLEEYCNLRIITNEKEEKITFLYTIITSDDYFINKVINQYKLNNIEIEKIADKIEKDILNKNIPEYIIKRNFETYSRENYFIKKNLKQLSAISKNLNNLFITKKLEKVHNISIREVKLIIDNLTKKINDGHYYTSNMKTILLAEIDIASENKKIRAQKHLYNLHEKSQESFNNFLKVHDLTYEDKEELVKRLENLIGNGFLEEGNIKLQLVNTAKKIKMEKLNE